MLAPHGKYSYRDGPRYPGPRTKKTLRIYAKRPRSTNDDIKNEIKSECEEEGEEGAEEPLGGSFFSTKLMRSDRSGSIGYQSAALHREKVRKIKEDYKKKK